MIIDASLIIVFVLVVLVISLRILIASLIFVVIFVLVLVARFQSIVVLELLEWANRRGESR